MFAFIVTTLEKEFILFAEDKEKAIKKFNSSKGRTIVKIEKIEDYDSIYELEC